jgi:hypothetical protein
MDEKIISFLRALYWIWKEEEIRFLNKLSWVSDKYKEKLLISLYERNYDINKINTNFNNGIIVMMNSVEEKLENLVNV